MSPLTRRLPREFKNNLGKYVGIFLLMVLAISLTTGFLAAATSIERILDGARDAYTIEDGRFTTAFEAPRAALDAVEDLGVTVYESYSHDVDLTIPRDDARTGITARVYRHREHVDLAAYTEGEAPATSSEIALDRTFAAHNDLTVGDAVEVGGRTFTVSGIMTLPDYQSLFQENSSFVFDSLTFTVAEVTPEGFEALGRDVGSTPRYTYAFVMDDRDLTIAERTDIETDMVEALADNGATVTDLLDASANQGIAYVADDVEGDQSMWEALMLLLIAIMAFMFVVLTSSTIEEESAIIGTLLASGYRRRELVLHYLLLPCLVGTLAAVVGNVLGYTLLSDPMRGLYYNSYSLPPYEAFWNWRVFLLTTVAPLVLLVGITLLGLMRKLRCTPLQFLRHETVRRGTRRGAVLPDRLGFVTRFRLRVLLRNVGNFVTLFFGIAFASLLMLFGLCTMPTMEHYADQLKDTVVAEHLYTLKAPLEIEGTEQQREAWAAVAELASVADIDDLGLSQEDQLELLQQAAAADTAGHPVNTRENTLKARAYAEKFAVTSLVYDRGDDAGEEPVTVYGIQPRSRYWDDVAVDAVGNTIVLGTGLARKFGIEAGDTVSLCDKYANETHRLKVDGIYGEASNMNAYLSLDAFRDEFDQDADYFNGYASNEELDLDPLYLAGETTPADMQKVADQMNESMREMTGILTGAATAIFLVFMYLLTKTVIDRSARAIAYMKVFGYRDREINRLYLHSITCTVVVSLIACMPLLLEALAVIFRVMLYDVTGYIEIYAPVDKLAVNVAVGLASYAIVAVLHTRHIKNVPLALALKAQE